MEKESNNDIRLLEFPACIRERLGMYVGGVEDGSVLFREVVDNSFDESYAWKSCDKILIDQNWNGYHLIADNGRGMPIIMSPDKPNQTMADVAVTSLHSGSKFSSTEDARNGMNGCGVKAVNALSESFILLSKITADNFDKSIPEVEHIWNTAGPRSRKDLYYILAFERGIKVFEGADKLSVLESKIFMNLPRYTALPTDMSTIVMFIPDSTIFDKVTSKVPIKNIQYFLLIQEKFYKKKVQVMVNGQLVSESFNPYRFEITRTITPADTSKNRTVSIYATFDVDPELGDKIEEGSVSGLVVEQGVHINYVTTCFEAALKKEFKINHKYSLKGLRICVIVLAGDVIFDSQTKSRLKSITKVKVTDFAELAKDFTKIFRNDLDYWTEHVEKLNFFAESMKSFTATDKAKKMVESSAGTGLYKTRASLVKGFADATAGDSDRFNCELFLCEGDSPAGSLKGGRKDTRLHAVMPLRGKVLNVSEKTAEQMLDNKELYTIFKVIGLGLDVYNVTEGANSAEEAYQRIVSASRYGKIIIACDADPDGYSIMNSLLYAVAKFGRFLIDFGLMYVVESPLFSQGGKYFYPSDPIQPGTIFPVGLNPSKHFKRYKGLGSLNAEDIYDVFYNPETRRLIQVTPEGLDYAMSLVEDIKERKRLLYDSGILSNPYGFTDI